MGRYAIIEGGRVANVVTATPEVAAERGWYIAPDGVEAGWTFDGTFHAPITDDATARAAIRPVTMRQARLALLGAGLLDAATTAINALPSPQKATALIEWEFASEFRRDNALIAAIGGALGLSDNQIDTLFRTAAGL